MNDSITSREPIAEMDGFKIVQEGKNSSFGDIEMHIRPLKGGAEGTGLAISYITSKMDKTGDYIPVEINEEKAARLVKYLQEVLSIKEES